MCAITLGETVAINIKGWPKLISDLMEIRNIIQILRAEGNLYWPVNKMGKIRDIYNGPIELPSTIILICLLN